MEKYYKGAFMCSSICGLEGEHKYDHVAFSLAHLLHLLQLPSSGEGRCNLRLLYTNSKIFLLAAPGDETLSPFVISLSPKINSIYDWPILFFSSCILPFIFGSLLKDNVNKLISNLNIQYFVKYVVIFFILLQNIISLVL